MKSKKQIEAEVKNEIAKLKPYVKDLISATNMYNQSPSIQNGSRRYDAKEIMFKAIADITQNISHSWLNEYSKSITKEEMDEIFKVAFDSVTFEDMAN